MLESISFTATLIHYVAQMTGRTVADTAAAIGRYNIARLCHNAPMNRILPLAQIAREVIYDNALFRFGFDAPAEPDYSFGESIANTIGREVADKHRYADRLYELLCNA